VISDPWTGGWARDPTGRYAFRWWDGTKWTDLVSSSGTTARDQVAGVGPGPATGPVEYRGPLPSPAKRWAPFVITAAAAAGVASVVLVALNLMERHNQQQRLTGTASAAHIQTTLHAIHWFSNFSVGATWALVAVAVVWEIQRRPRTRRTVAGEHSVEPLLRHVAPVAYWTFCAAALAVLLLGAASASASHGTTAPDFVWFRTLRVACDAARVFMFGCWIAVVVRSTQRQTQREAPSIAAPATSAGEPAIESAALFSR
jgi:hypothetical protein